MREHWLFHENGIVFADHFNLIPIERSLRCQLQLNGVDFDTHKDDTYDRNYNNHFKGISSKVLQIRNLNKWHIVHENIQGIRSKIDDMVSKMQNYLAKMYNCSIAKPNITQVNDVKSVTFENFREDDVVVFVLNSRAKKDQLTRKYELIKYKMYDLKDKPSQVILSKTFEQQDFLKMVVLNLMYDIVLKLPNTIGHKIKFNHELSEWMKNGSTMVFAMDVFSKRGYKSVASILHYETSDMTVFHTDYIVKGEGNPELGYNDETKESLKSIIRTAISNYESTNGKNVTKIVFLRDGITDYQRRVVENTEIK